MMLPLHIARKLQALLRGDKLPLSSARHAVVDRLLAEGIVDRQLIGRSKSVLVVRDRSNLLHFLRNQFGIADLDNYIETLAGENTTRSAAVVASGNSKLKQVRTFTGFLVSAMNPLEVNIAGQLHQLTPLPGMQFFISDYPNFLIPADVVVIGVENSENFLQLQHQQHLFGNLKALFVCRYPYSSDLLKWLLKIPNRYLHFGDSDFAGIRIFLTEFYPLLKERASFFVPPDLALLLEQYGNRNLYNKQQHLVISAEQPGYTLVQPLIELLHRFKKALEQEVLIKYRSLGV